LGFKISISDILLATKFRIETELNKFDEVEMSFLQETHASSRNLSLFIVNGAALRMIGIQDSRIYVYGQWKQQLAKTIISMNSKIIRNTFLLFIINFTETWTLQERSLGSFARILSCWSVFDDRDERAVLMTEDIYLLR